MSIAMWNCQSGPLDVSAGGGGTSAGISANCHSWPLDVSSNVKWPFWITRCGYWGVHLPKYVHLSSFVYWYSSHLCSINWGVHWPKKVCPDKYEHTSKLLLNNFQCNCLQEINSCLGSPLAKIGLFANFGVLLPGRPSAKVCLSAKFCVLVFKASMLY